MNSKRLAVFAASLQWADAVKVVSRGTPRSRTSVTWGVRWSVSAAENEEESGGRFTTVRHAHLLGLIGRPHFSAQAQAEESEDRRRIVWIVGTPFSRHLRNQVNRLPETQIVLNLIKRANTVKLIKKRL